MQCPHQLSIFSIALVILPILTIFLKYHIKDGGFLKQFSPENPKTNGTLFRKCSSRAFQWMVMSVGFNNLKLFEQFLRWLLQSVYIASLSAYGLFLLKRRPENGHGWPLTKPYTGQSDAKIRFPRRVETGENYPSSPSISVQKPVLSQTNPQRITLTFGCVTKTSPRPGEIHFFASKWHFWKPSLLKWALH
jgi:hypothetical protein